MSIKNVFVGLIVLVLIGLSIYVYQLNSASQMEAKRIQRHFDMLSGKVEMPVNTLRKAPVTAESEPALTVIEPTAESLDSAVKNQRKIIPSRPRDYQTKTSLVNLSAEERADLQQKASVKQAELKQLINELNQNLKYKDKKQQIQTKIDTLLAEYNQLVLPLALTAMAEQNRG